MKNYIQNSIIMPLLGRHKSLNTSNTSTTSTTNNSTTGNQSGRYTSTSTPSSASHSPTSSMAASSGSGQLLARSTPSRRAKTPQLCESPLFGIRRQLDVSLPSEENNHEPSSQSSNSIPQQITRQQIHYAFSIMDTDSDGLIDLRDFSQMLANLGVPIDEAILSHIMSTVSKRGDRRVGEKEFLEWISLFIQVSDGTSSPSATHGPKSAAAPLKSSSSGKVKRAASKTRVARSSTAGSSLVADQPEAVAQFPLRNRRGSGSGLALMRSLSSGSTSGESSSMANESRHPSSVSDLTSSGSGSSSSGHQLTTSHGRTEVATGSATADDEARNDLKAAFCVFDIDGDGYITLDEVRSGLKLLGESWTPAELSALFARCTSTPHQLERPHRQTQLPLGQQRISIDDFVQLLL